MMSNAKTTRTMFKGGTVITMDAAAGAPAPADVLIEEGRIAAVGEDLCADDCEFISAEGCIVLPGLIDAHHHMWLGSMRRLMPDVDDLFDYIAVVAETLGVHYRPVDMYQSTRLTALASLDAGITTIVDACHSSRSPEHTDAAIEAIESTGIRALHMVGAAMDKQASSAHLPGDLKRLADNWNGSGGLVQVGLFGMFNLEWWRVARDLDMRILTEFIGDLAQLGPEFAQSGLLGPHNIFNHCTRIPRDIWKLFAETGVNVTVNPRSDALFGFDDEGFAYQQAVDHGLRPALGIDLDTAFGSDMFGEMHALFGQQRSAMRYRRFRGEDGVPPPVTAAAVLEASTVNGARVVGLEDEIGVLAAGRQADVIMIRTDDVAIFPVNDPVATIVQAVERSNVDTVMVAGTIRKRRGVLVGVDMLKERVEIETSLDHLLAASGYRPRPSGRAGAQAA